MDKRTVIYLVVLAAAFFGINFFFQYQDRERLKQWNEQQFSVRKKKFAQLKTQIEKRTSEIKNVPIVEIYNDSAATEFLTSGIKDQDAILTLSWDENPPRKVFITSGENSKPEEYYLLYKSNHVHGTLIYQPGGTTKVLIGDLPDFGRFELALFSPIPGRKEKPYILTPIDYTDGHLTIPAEQLYKLQKELGMESEGTPPLSLPKSIVLFKLGSSYLPVATYIPETRNLMYFEDMEGLASLIDKPKAKEIETTLSAGQEKYYVLENNYQQLVFSNYGGALVEINLPFAGETNKQSVVREIEFDKEIVKDHPYNAHFPSHPYYAPGKNPKGPFEEHIEGKIGGYYPLIRRDLIQTNTRKTVRIPPRFYSLNIVSEYPEMAEMIYQVKQFDPNTIVFEATQGHRHITKTYSIATEEKGAPYCIDLTIKIDGDSRGLWLTSGIPEVEIISGSPAPSLKYRISRNGKADVESVDLPKDAFTNGSLNPDWISNSNGFLGIIMDTTTPIDPGFRVQYVPGSLAPSRLVEIGQDYERYKAQDLPGYIEMLPLNSKGGEMKFVIFAGPFADSILKTVDAFYSDPSTGYNPDFIASQTFHGWFAFISEPFAKFLFVLMNFFYSVTGSWAFSIILLTVALRLMLYPLNAWSTRSMLRMQQIAPEVTAIQDKYKKDPKKAQIEIMNLYRERGVNPMTGCLPLLIQMPFLIGMFDLLKSTFELRGASFIPGWIDNLTSPDVLFSWSTPIFFIGNQFHLLPFLLGGVMFLQQRMMSTLPKDPSQWTEQQRQQRMMGSMMTVIFTVMFYNFPSGLNIYWLSSMILGILQQWWMQRGMQKEPVKGK